MNTIQRLNELASDPQAHAEFAIGLLGSKAQLDVRLAALQALKDVPAPQAHEPLLRLYAHYAANGPKRDPGAHIRRAVLDALRPIALPADLALIEEAVTIYEFLPPGFKEDGVLLRAGALLILNELDVNLARFHATRLLVDGYTQAMSAEPALTAVRVLESQAEYLPLYQLAMNAQSGSLPDVVSECLRALTAIPAPLIAGIVERHGQSADGAVLIGLYDLLIGHQDGPQELEYLASSLLTQPDLDVYSYLLIALFSSRNPGLISLAANTLRLETAAARRATALETARLFQSDPAIADLISVLERS